MKAEGTVGAPTCLVGRIVLDFCQFCPLLAVLTIAIVMTRWWCSIKSDKTIGFEISILNNALMMKLKKEGGSSILQSNIASRLLLVALRGSVKSTN
jgi:hypothetical protein